MSAFSALLSLLSALLVAATPQDDKPPVVGWWVVERCKGGREDPYNMVRTRRNLDGSADTSHGWELVARYPIREPQLAALPSGGVAHVAGNPKERAHRKAEALRARLRFQAEN